MAVRPITIAYTGTKFTSFDLYYCYTTSVETFSLTSSPDSKWIYAGNFSFPYTTSIDFSGNFTVMIIPLTANKRAPVNTTTVQNVAAGTGSFVIETQQSSNSYKASGYFYNNTSAHTITVAAATENMSLITPSYRVFNTEMNIQLKDGNMTLYPQTKAANVIGLEDYVNTLIAARLAELQNSG